MKNEITFKKIQFNILAWSIEDSIDLFFVAAFVREFYGYKDLNLVKKITLEVIKKLLEEEVVKAGDLLKGNNFVVWDKTIYEIIIDIKNKWNSLDRKLHPQEIVWFEITEKGRKEFEYLKSLSELKETDPFYFDDNNC